MYSAVVHQPANPRLANEACQEAIWRRHMYVCMYVCLSVCMYMMQWDSVGPFKPV